MTRGIELFAEVDCFDFCEIIRLAFTTYVGEPFNHHAMNDGSGYFYGCICR